MGIANSVDLPFRKKHSAIAMRDCTLLFSPYDTEQLMDVLEVKMNIRRGSLPSKMKTKEFKAIFMAMVDPRAREFIARKVSK